MADRFYLPHYRNDPTRPVYLQDLGNLLTIAGVVIQGMGSTLVLMLPAGDEIDLASAEVAYPSLDEWGVIIRQSDVPEIFVGDVGGVRKILQRKARWEISGQTQQRVWARDGFKCLYCGRKMGETLMTIDHFVPLELGGENDESNYLSSCRGCNKKKGMMTPEAFCAMVGRDYEGLKTYLKGFTS